MGGGPKHRHLSRVIYAIIAAGVVAASGCGGGGQTMSKDLFIDGFMTKSGLTREQAVCATDRLFTDLTPSEIKAAYDADAWEDLTEKERRALTQASLTCLTPPLSPSRTSPPTTTSPQGTTSTSTPQ